MSRDLVVVLLTEYILDRYCEWPLATRRLSYGSTMRNSLGLPVYQLSKSLELGTSRRLSHFLTSDPRLSDPVDYRLPRSLSSTSPMK